MRRAALAGIGAALLLAGSSPAAELSVGVGSSLDLGTGSLDLGCADLGVAGTLSAGTVGFVAARDVTIDPTGTLHGNSATLEVAGDFDNAGTFDAGTSTVRLVDGCGLLSAVVAGNSVFANVELATTNAKEVSFTAGSTQTVTGSLSLSGLIGALLKIRSTLGGSAAFLDAQGTSSASYVDVEDNDATAGNPIALGPDSIKGANTPGWVLSTLVPSISLLGGLGLASFLFAHGVRQLRRSVSRPAPSSESSR